MLRGIVPVVLLAALFTTQVAAQRQVLYEHKPWLVWRESTNPPICAARVLGSDSMFQLMGAKQGAGISIARVGWHFSPHKGGLLLKVDDAGMGTASDAIYDGQVVKLWGATEVIYVIMHGIDVPGGTQMEVLGDDRKVIATFDITGFDAALKAWKTCVDGS